MKSLLLALQFLTVTPVKCDDCSDRDLAKSLVFYPFIGFVIGFAIWIALKVCYLWGLGAFAYAIIPVVLLAVLTGGLHLDGLSDTFDGLASGKGKEEALAIMRDPHSGALGVTAVVCVLLLKIAFIAAIPLYSRGQALMLACVAARWPLVFSIWKFPYARKEGKASAYFNGVNGKILLTAGAIAVICASLAAGWKGLVITAAVTLFCVLFDIRMERKLGGITGDTLGASVECAEVLALMMATFIY